MITPEAPASRPLPLTQEIRDRTEKATKGPWELRRDPGHFDSLTSIRAGGAGRIVEANTEADASFIAHAREDVPWLLDQLADREARIATLEAEREAMHRKWERAEALLTKQDGALEGALAELRSIDAVLARRPACDKPTRRENIEHALSTAGRKTDECHRLTRRAEAAEARLATLEAERAATQQERDKLEVHRDSYKASWEAAVRRFDTAEAKCLELFADNRHLRRMALCEKHVPDEGVGVCDGCARDLEVAEARIATLEADNVRLAKAINAANGSAAIDLQEVPVLVASLRRRCEDAEARIARLEQALRRWVELFDGFTEPVHPVLWQVELAAAKALLAAQP